MVWTQLPIPNVVLYWAWLPNATLSSGVGTKCNNTLGWYHCNNIVVTTINTDTSAKCSTVVHNNTSGTKCNNNDWSYHGNGAKCDTIVAMVLNVATAPL